MKRTVSLIATFTFVAFTISACGGTTSPVVTVTAPAPAATTPVAAPGQIVVPDGVGMNYQSAQDAWRAAGLHVAPATDGSGAHRLPIVDSNWLVLAQDPKAGSMVPEDSFITATVKKYTDQ